MELQGSESLGPSKRQSPAPSASRGNGRFRRDAGGEFLTRRGKKTRTVPRYRDNRHKVSRIESRGRSNGRRAPDTRTRFAPAGPRERKPLLLMLAAEPPIASRCRRVRKAR